MDPLSNLAKMEVRTRLRVGRLGRFKIPDRPACPLVC